MVAYIQILWIVLRRECLLRFRHRQDCINPLLFFIVVAALFPLATTPSPAILTLIGPGVIWVAALLALLLSLSNLFQEDAVDGTLEQMLLTPFPLSLLVAAKLLAHWLMQTFPVILVAPVMALLFHLSWHAIGVLWLTLLMGMPILSLVGAIGAALTVGLRHAGLLLALLLLPMYVPALIFGTSAVIAANAGMPMGVAIAILGALLTLALCLAPLTAAFALRIGMNT